MPALPVEDLVELDVGPSVGRRIPGDGDGRDADRLNGQMAHFGRNGGLRRQRDASGPMNTGNV